MGIYPPDLSWDWWISGPAGREVSDRCRSSYVDRADNLTHFCDRKRGHTGIHIYTPFNDEEKIILWSEEQAEDTQDD